MYFVYRDGKYIDVAGKSFRDFMAGKIPELKGIEATIGDWSDHLTTAFPEVRLKKFLEMRGADGGPWKRLCALPAFWVGLLYDAAALEGAWQISKEWTAEDRERVRAEVPRLGLKARIGSRTVRDVALEMIDDQPEPIAQAAQRLRDLVHAHRALHARVYTFFFQSVLQSQRVDHRRQHSHVVAGRSIDLKTLLTAAAKNIATADHDRNFDAQFVNLLEFLRNRLHGLAVNPEALRPLHRFARQFQDDALVFWPISLRSALQRGLACRSLRSHESPDGRFSKASEL